MKNYMARYLKLKDIFIILSEGIYISPILSLLNPLVKFLPKSFPFVILVLLKEGAIVVVWY